MRKVIAFAFSALALAALQAQAPGSSLKTWTFDSGTEGFIYNADWNYQYAGKTKVSAENGMLKVTADYSKNAGDSWSQLSLTVSDRLEVAGADCVSFDWYFNPDCMSGGSLKAKVVLQDQAYAEAASGNGQANIGGAADADNVPGMKKTRVEVRLNRAVKSPLCVTLALQLVGSGTDYKGDMYIDNVSIGFGEPLPDLSVDSTVAVTGAKDQVSADGGVVSLNGKTSSSAAPSEARLADSGADAAARALYAYLAAVGNSDSLIYGHQDDTFQKAGSVDLSSSDTKDVTGSIAGVVGIDALAMTGNEYSVSKYNAAHPNANIPDTPENNVRVAAMLADEAIKEGAIVTVSMHVPNLSLVKPRASYAFDGPAYTRFDFSGYTPNTIDGDVMNNILPGGIYNFIYNSYLDMVADFAKQVAARGGAILFRPFHENTGSWFWWGAAHCDAEQFKNVYRYTVSYLRDTKGVHNFIYIYGPSDTAESEDDFAVRYPGDEWVDMVGFDSYHNDPAPGDGWFDNLKKQVEIVDSFAKSHGKLFCVAETGMSSSVTDEGMNRSVLRVKDNKVKDWYKKVGDIVSASSASYFLLWANFSKEDGYYTPFVDKQNSNGTLHGHELLDQFIEFFNDPRTIFASNQKDALSKITSALPMKAKANDEPSAFVMSPVPGSRVLKAAQLSAKAFNVSGPAEFAIVDSNGKEKTIKTSLKNGSYMAKLSSGDLKKMGETRGTVEFRAGGKTLCSNKVMFNMKPPKEDPLVVDTFENYMGDDAALNAVWAINKDSGCSIAFTLDSSAAGADKTALKFSYTETSSGWAGATMNKKADWSKCDALEFYTKGDGNNQKVVVQVTAGGSVYEAYLNTYDEYRDNTAPMLVTIPFADFVARDIGGHPKGGLEKDKGSITSIGLWLNAIDGTPAIVDGKVSGEMLYDNIKAVKSGKKSATFQAL